MTSSPVSSTPSTMWRRAKSMVSGLIEKLVRHGYRISPGTLYLMLQAMEERGYLTSREDSDGRLGRRRRVYTITAEGRRGLGLARERLRELTGEVGHQPKTTPRATATHQG